MTARRTSIEAYHAIKEGGLLSYRRMQIYEVLYEHGPLTANEIFRMIIGKSSINQANVPARLNEMREMGCVEELGEKQCSVTNNNVILWDVTGRIPIRIEKKKRDVCQHCNGTGYEPQIRLF